MKLIAAVDKNWGIGANGELLVSIPEDMQYFRGTTSGHVVIMGRTTFETFPGNKGLSDRVNIVITENPNYKAKDAIMVHSVEEAVETAKQYTDKDCFVIGGASIYKQMLPYCDTAFITYIDFAYAADCYMVNLDEESDWKCVEEGEEQTYFDLEYYFRVYKRNA